MKKLFMLVVLMLGMVGFVGCCETACEEPATEEPATEEVENEVEVENVEEVTDLVLNEVEVTE